MTNTLERFADLGLTTDGGVLGEVVSPARTPAGGTGGTSRRGGEKAQEGVAESMGDRRKQRNTRLPHAASRALSIGDRENQEHRTPSRVQLPTDRS